MDLLTLIAAILIAASIVLCLYEFVVKHVISFGYSTWKFLYREFTLLSIR